MISENCTFPTDPEEINLLERIARKQLDNLGISFTKMLVYYLWMAENKLPLPTAGIQDFQNDDDQYLTYDWDNLTLTYVWEKRGWKRNMCWKKGCMDYSHATKSLLCANHDEDYEKMMMMMSNKSTQTIAKLYPSLPFDSFSELNLPTYFGLGMKLAKTPMIMSTGVLTFDLVYTLTFMFFPKNWPVSNPIIKCFWADCNNFANVCSKNFAICKNHFGFDMEDGQGIRREVHRYGSFIKMTQKVHGIDGSPWKKTMFDETIKHFMSKPDFICDVTGTKRCIRVTELNNRTIISESCFGKFKNYICPLFGCIKCLKDVNTQWCNLHKNDELRETVLNCGDDVIQPIDYLHHHNECRINTNYLKNILRLIWIRISTNEPFECTGTQIKTIINSLQDRPFVTSNGIIIKTQDYGDTGISCTKLALCFHSGFPLFEKCHKTECLVEGTLASVSRRRYCKTHLPTRIYYLHEEQDAIKIRNAIQQFALKNLGIQVQDLYPDSTWQCILKAIAYTNDKNRITVKLYRGEADIFVNKTTLVMTAILKSSKRKYKKCSINLCGLPLDGTGNGCGNH